MSLIFDLNEVVRSVNFVYRISEEFKATYLSGGSYCKNESSSASRLADWQVEGISDVDFAASSRTEYC
jgi:hypothetical protein